MYIRSLTKMQARPLHNTCRNGRHLFMANFKIRAEGRAIILTETNGNERYGKIYQIIFCDVKYEVSEWHYENCVLQIFAYCICVLKGIQ